MKSVEFDIFFHTISTYISCIDVSRFSNCSFQRKKKTYSRFVDRGWANCEVRLVVGGVANSTAEGRVSAEGREVVADSGVVGTA